MNPDPTSPQRHAADGPQQHLAQRHQEAFLRLGQKLNSATTAEQAGEIIVEIAEELIGFDSCLFGLYSSEQNLIHGLVGYDLMEGRRVRIPNTYTGIASPRILHALQHGGQLVLRGNPEADSKDSNPFGDTTRRSASILDVPIREADKVIGMLTIQSYSPNAYSRADLKTLEALADYCSGALERIRAQEALLESEGNFRELAEAIPHMVWTTGPNGESQYCNRRWHEYTGYGSQKIRGRGWIEPIHPDHRERVIREWNESLQTGTILETEYLLRRFSDGAYRWHVDRGIPLRDSDGRIIKWFGTCTDIHEKKKAEEITQQLTQELEERVQERTAALKEANEHLEAFSYTVSHDLRAPLRTMRAFTQVLLQDYPGRLDAAGEDFLRRICDSAQKMDRLINDLLEYSRISRMELELGPVAMESVLESVLVELRNDIQARNASIDIAGPLPEVLGHRRILEQIFLNLISNALKYVAARPHIQIGAETREGVARLLVDDNGIGVAAEHHERIFRPFERGHGSENFPGTGIGLAIVQKGAERMNGRVGVESRGGKGSRFWVELPSSNARRP